MAPRQLYPSREIAICLEHDNGQRSRLLFSRGAKLRRVEISYRQTATTGTTQRVGRRTFTRTGWPERLLSRLDVGFNERSDQAMQTGCRLTGLLGVARGNPEFAASTSPKGLLFRTPIVMRPIFSSARRRPSPRHVLRLCLPSQERMSNIELDGGSAARLHCLWAVRMLALPRAFVLRGAVAAGRTLQS